MCLWLTYNPRAMAYVRVWLVALLAGSVAVAAQTPQTFKARLSTMPVEAANSASVTGSGEVTAVLTGTKLSIRGTFTGLQGPATVARIHVAPLGLRGPAMLDITVTKATSGTLSGDLTLTPIQADHLVRKRLYVQVHSEKAPDGNLRGWLLP
jgi:CHRD domain